MYVGDSITDVSSFNLVRKNEGLTVSFNGNKYAIREAEIAVLSDNTIVTSIIAYTFQKYGKDAVLELVNEWGYSILKKYTDSGLERSIIDFYPTKLPQVEIINDENRMRLTTESRLFRKTIRGEAVGQLG
jgi:energy-converting hydrogenase A subunit R